MKKINLLKIYLFISFIFLLSILTFLMAIKFRNKPVFLIAEQRYSSSFPSLKGLRKTILTGEFTKSFEKFYSDRIFARSAILKYKTYLDMNVFGKSHISDVILSKNRDKAFRFRSQDVNVDIDSIQKGIKDWSIIKSELDKLGTKIIVVAVADQSHIFTQEYPYGAYNDFNRFISMKSEFLKGLDKIGIEYIDLYEQALENKSHYYTNGDHHQNFNLTLEAYKHLLEKTKKINIDLDDVTKKSILKTSDNKFIGSHNRKLFGLLDELYKMQYLSPKEEIRYNRFDNGEKSNRPIFEDSNYYTSYMGGDISETIIDTNRKKLPNIMVLGDSTSNSLETILWMNANVFTSLDFRKYKEMNIVEYVKKHPQDLIVISIISGNFVNLGSIMK